jgi:hypothetical protein
MSMTLNEKILYHQIHPLKLLTDISTGLFTTYLLWQHNILWFLLLFLLPSMVATLLLTRFAKLERLRDSKFGRYIKRYMTSVMQMVRLLGQIVMWVSAWHHSLILIFVGFLIIVGGWCGGILPHKS